MHCFNMGCLLDCFAEFVHYGHLNTFYLARSNAISFSEVIFEPYHTNSNPLAFFWTKEEHWNVEYVSVETDEPNHELHYRQERAR